MRKAIIMAQPEDQIVALHIPKLVPEMMLSSLSDPTEAPEDVFSALQNTPGKAGERMQAKIKEAADDELKKQGKSINIKYTVAPPSGNIKAEILRACTVMGANLLVVGPGVNGHGSIPPFVTTNAKGYTVCVVRDHIE